MIHLKRFHSDSHGYTKLQFNVEFPLTDFDIARYIVGESPNVGSADLKVDRQIPMRLLFPETAAVRHRGRHEKQRPFSRPVFHCQAVAECPHGRALHKGEAVIGVFVLRHPESRRKFAVLAGKHRKLQSARRKTEMPLRDTPARRPVEVPMGLIHRFRSSPPHSISIGYYNDSGHFFNRNLGNMSEF